MISERTLSTMLLTLRLDAVSTKDLQPLKVNEWNQVAKWLDDQNFAPETLIGPKGESLLDSWGHKKISRERLARLLDRGNRIAKELEKWESTGMWILGRSDRTYPQNLRRRLKSSAPPILFGFGDQRLFDSRGLAIVGSRDANEDQARLAEALGLKAAEEEFTVVSGGARGIDSHSEQGAYDGGGAVISVLADSLLRRALRREHRNHLTGASLLILTPYSPEAGFSAGTAMGRNKLIYCLADAAIAVCSTAGKGGTFTGASEAIKETWVPVWAPKSSDPSSGNVVLIKNGARELPPISDFSIESLTVRSSNSETPAIQKELFEGR